jgi:hypothetical protein
MSIFGSDIGPPLRFLSIVFVIKLGVTTFEYSLFKSTILSKNFVIVSALSETTYPLKLPESQYCPFDVRS